MSKACRTWLFAVVIVVAMALGSSAQTFMTLVNFAGPNGALPDSPPVQGLDGKYYGTTQYGGTSGSCGRYNCGTLYRIDDAALLTNRNLINANGSGPVAALVLAADKKFYGLAVTGGTYGWGSIFSMDSSGTVSLLHSFCAGGYPPCADGREPNSPLAQGIDGNLYGTTEGGGGGAACPFQGDCGTVFKMTTSGQLTTLHSFCAQPNCVDGEFPDTALVQGSDGDFYGTTTAGGTSANCEGGSCGTIFKITRNGVLTTVYSFDNADGNTPEGALLQAPDGNFYGTTSFGGAYAYGTVFQLTLGGVFTTLYSFCAGGRPCADGSLPFGTLVLATDGNLYGTTSEGGTEDLGTIFKITTSGMLTTLHSFDNTDGSGPTGLMQATNGMLYGTTAAGGNFTCRAIYGCGTFFALDLGLDPFVTFVRTAAKLNQQFGILGQGFTGTTAVSLNGTPAAFTIKSDTYLTATVPVGATTGYVTVTTPSGTLTSNNPFVVIP